MGTLFALTLYLRRLVSFYFDHGTGNLADIVRLEEEFFHDLKGLFSKRLGLPITKFKLGGASQSLANDIFAGAHEVVDRFNTEESHVFRTLPPSLKLVRLFGHVSRLESALRMNQTELVVDRLERLRESYSSYYHLEIKSSFFELRTLLVDLVSAHAAALTNLERKIQLVLSAPEGRKSIRLPYSDFSVWRRILDNIVLNAIEAVEATECGGEIRIGLTFLDNERATLEVVDTGIGMDASTLSSFATRGFTRGKANGQGLGMNESSIQFLEKFGTFSARSTPGVGTGITITINSARALGVRVQRHFVRPAVWRRLRMALVICVLIVVGVILVSWPTVPVANVRATGAISGAELSFRSVTAYDKDDNALWTYSFSGPYLLEYVDGHSCGPLRTDLDRDGKNETVVVLHSSEDQTGEVICLDERGHEWWRYRLGLASGATVFGSTEVELFNGSHLQAFDLPDLGPILVVVAVPKNFACQVLVLNRRGEKLAEYWHTGYVYPYAPPRDIDGDGKDELLLAGQNNLMGWAPCVIALKVPMTIGQSLPGLDKNLPMAKEPLYYLFGKPWVNDSGGYQDVGGYVLPDNAVAIVGARINPDYNPFGAPLDSSIAFTAQDGRTITFDRHLNLLGISCNDSLFGEWWKGRKTRRTAVRDLDQTDKSELIGYRKYVKGQMVLDNILIHAERYDRFIN
jgi:signal transduction histidine kinase